MVEEHKAAMIGVDTASLDYGRSKDFIVHRIAAAENLDGRENLTNLEKLPATGATIIALPMKIEGGSGGPARVSLWYQKPNERTRAVSGVWAASNASFEPNPLLFRLP